MEDNDRFVDELLDSAMAHHQAAEPRAGLETRILTHVRIASQESSRRRSRRLWFVAAATAAAVVVFIAIHVDHRPQNPAPQTAQTGSAVPSPPKETLKANSEPTPAPGPATKAVEPKRIARHKENPSHQVEAHHWPSQFPTPAPLTNEQKALVRYVQKTPPEVLATPVLKSDFTVHLVEIKPLKIAPLEIKPLALAPGHEEMR
jgi:hypothetical protein